ncbi:hypothetical protein JTB14_033755 [Gonioctena quinquepunctata]|nr:hypothetical protein JTB14_033755 [Gonioctena quinquepunctata]
MQKERMFLNNEESSTESSDNNGDQDELEKEQPKKSDDYINKNKSETQESQITPGDTGDRKEELKNEEEKKGVEKPPPSNRPPDKYKKSQKLMEIPPYRGGKAILSPIQEKAIGTITPSPKKPPSEHEGELPPNNKELLQAEEIHEELKEKTEIYGKNKIKEGDLVPMEVDTSPPQENNEKFEDEYFKHLSDISEDEEYSPINIEQEKFQEKIEEIKKLTANVGEKAPSTLYPKIIVQLGPVQSDGPSDCFSSSSEDEKEAIKHLSMAKKDEQSKRNIKRRKTSKTKEEMEPKITSTPLKRESIFATPPKPRILSPRRYSLSEIATPPRTNRRDISRSNSHQNSPGPLLASTKYNINVSTYEDTKTPGLAGRIVQYNEEAEREKELKRRPTHQAKYGTVGLFPIVHLFKKKLPQLEEKPRHVTVRIASPDYARHHTQEYNRKLLEGIVKPGGGAFGLSQPKNESTNTRSVLDALKEISRKRMHANEEVEVYEESGKRLRTDKGEVSEGTKRQRDESPLLDTTTSPSSKPVSKKICMYDEYAASCSSMDFSLKKSQPLVPKRKSVNISTLTDNPKESKQVKLINAETQTTVEEKYKSTDPKDKEENETGANESNDNEKESSGLKVFDEAPLERIRKNRLAALLGSLAGKDAALVQKPDLMGDFDKDADKCKITTDSSEMNNTNKPLVSILSTPNKSPNKSDRHVHFSVPESTTQTSSTLSSSTTSTIGQPDSLSGTRLGTPTPPSSPVNFVPANLSNTTSSPSFSFGSAGNKASPMTTLLEKNESNPNNSRSLISKESTLNVNTSKQSASGKPAVPTFETIPSTSSNQLNSTSATSGPPKLGGFKFDLNKPSTTLASISNNAQLITSPSFNISASQKPKADVSLFGNISQNVTVHPSSSTIPSFSFGPKTTVASGSGAMLGTTTTTTTINSPIVNNSTIPSFNFGSSKTDGAVSASSANKTQIFGTPTNSPSASNPAATSLESTKTSSFSFGNSALAPGTNTQSPPFSFGAQKASVTTSSLATSVTSSGIGGFTVTTTSSPLATTFTVPTTSTNAGFSSSQATIFVNDKLGPTFGNPLSTTSSPFGNNSTSGQTSLPFGTTTTDTTNTFGNMKPSTASSFMFAGSKNLPGTTPKIFGGTTVTQASGLGIPTTNSTFGTGADSAFGTVATTAPAFGNSTSTTIAYGSKTTVSNTFGGFGAPTTTDGGFGVPTTTNGGFGAPTTNAGFGAPTTTNAGFGVPTTSTGGFGSTASSGFGMAQNTGFGTTNANAGFGTTPTTNNVFGATTNANPGFAATASATSSFGASNSFGNTTNFGQNAFGGASNVPNNSSFGVATTTQSSGFGTMNNPPTTQASTPSFGGFTSPNKDSVFGSAPSAAFGAGTSSSAFGASSPPPTFGSTGNPSSFGSTGSAFGKPQPATNMFGGGQSTNTFGTGNTFATNQPQATGSFSTPNPSSTQASVFSFGASTAAATPSGVFSFGGAAAPGDKPKFNFNSGNTAPPAFGNTSTPFGGTSAPSFAGTSAPSFGGTSAPSFGGTSAPSFGSTSAPSFGGTSAPRLVVLCPSFGLYPTFFWISTASCTWYFQYWKWSAFQTKDADQSEKEKLIMEKITLNVTDD